MSLKLFVIWIHALSAVRVVELEHVQPLQPTHPDDDDDSSIELVGYQSPQSPQLSPCHTFELVPFASPIASNTDHQPNEYPPSILSTDAVQSPVDEYNELNEMLKQHQNDYTASVSIFLQMISQRGVPNAKSFRYLFTASANDRDCCCHVIHDQVWLLYSLMVSKYHIQPDIQIIIAMLRLFRYRGDTHSVAHLWNSIITNSEYNLRPTDTVYRFIIETFANHPFAATDLEKMRHRGFPADLRLIHSLLRHYKHTNKVDQALKFWRFVTRNETVICFGIAPPAKATYNVIIRILSEGARKHKEEAMRLYEEMINAKGWYPWPDTVAVMAVIYAEYDIQIKVRPLWNKLRRKKKHAADWIHLMHLD